MQDMMRLIEPLIPQLRRYARSMLWNQAQADDLVQDCLLRVIDRWHQRRADGDARTWAFTILHNLTINHLRQKGRRGPHMSLEDVADDVFARPASQEVSLTYHDLQKSLAILPEEQRSVLLLVTVEDLSYAEAAKVLGVPLGTMMSRLARARERLLKMMEGENILPLHTPNIRRIK
ncbi:MAG: sigma-70 family RNA polymerase sigma factor [Rhodospirillales bacterium]|nr:sigma-70 family RNA polymerase sigma factor [Rhodospirillales bacterium]